MTVAPVLLHVGLGTFRPVKVKDITRHVMHEEYYEVPEQTAALIAASRSRGSRVIAVGTTTTRCLESAADEHGRVCPGSGWTGTLSIPAINLR